MYKMKEVNKIEITIITPDIVPGQDCLLYKSRESSDNTRDSSCQ